jgi:hypothetical protein
VVFKVGSEWAAVGGPVRLVGPDDGTDLGLDVPETLRAVFSAAGGSHADLVERRLNLPVGAQLRYVCLSARPAGLLWSTTARARVATVGDSCLPRWGHLVLR